MRPWILIAVACSALLAVVAGVMVMGPDPAPPPPDADLEEGGMPATGRRDAPFLPEEGATARPRRAGRDLTARLERLEHEVTRLRREVDALRSGSDMPPLDARAIDPGDDGFRAGVQAVLEQEREQERERRREQRRERFETFTEEALEELQAQARISDEQRQTIAALWASEADRIVPLFEEARGGDRSFGEIREEVEALRQETDAQVRALLRPEQMEAYDELRPRGPGRRGPDRD